MTAEYQFIRKLEAYLNEKFSDYTCKKLETMLTEYYNSVSITKIIRRRIERPKIEKVKEEVKGEKVYKIAATNEMLENDLEDFCVAKDIPVNYLTSKTNYMPKSEIITLRTEFCLSMLEKYLVTNKQLSELFSVHVSTVNFYIYGKKTTSKKGITYEY
jgi:hypothetical protein